MATLFGSPQFLSHPPTRTHHFSSSPQTFPASRLISITSDEQQQRPMAVSIATTTVENMDWPVAPSLTRRFSLGAGLAWAGFRAFGVISEQIRTRDVEKQEEFVLPNGIRYTELRVGDGRSPVTGDLVVFNLKGQVEGSEEVFVYTFIGEMKSLALVMGSRPYGKGICEGIEYVLRSMKPGGRRRVIVPPKLGFGDKGADFGYGPQIPPSATLEYVVDVDTVSVLPV